MNLLRINIRSFILILYLIGITLNPQSLFAQYDTTDLKNLYDRTLDFNNDKADSVLFYAKLIEDQSRKLNFDKGAVLSLRLKGIYQEFREEYDSAINYYYQTLEQARLLESNEYESSALSDLAMAYNNINQPKMARDFFIEALQVSLNRKEAMSIYTNGSNLGAIYNRLGYPDSALLYLEQAEDVAKKHNLAIDIHSLYNNIGNAWFHKGEWEKALNFFRRNYDYNQSTNDSEMLWYDCLNIGDVFFEERRYDSAYKYITLSYELAKLLGSKRKEADVNLLYAKYYAAKGDYKFAYQHFKSWRNLDTMLVNQHTLQTVARIQETYNLNQKEQLNKMLELKIDRQRLEKRNILFLALAIFALAVSAFVSLLLIRRKNTLLKRQNDLIQKQNNKLAQLNAEKNSLISVVSHDLNAPFTSIKMWSNVLLSDVSNYTSDQKRAIYHIQSSADNGEHLIKNLLYIEKEEIKPHVLNLEEMDLNAFLEDVVNKYHPQAQQKDIIIHYNPMGSHVFLMSDRQIISRICENLLSNAIKFTPRGKNVFVSLEDIEDAIQIKIEDEGVGIAPEDIPYLFSKYKKISSMPTEGEYSTGLGLSIVKRLVDELCGTVNCKSEPGKGSLFTVILPK